MLMLSMTKDQIKHMVDRFLGWKLPESFSPDAGISFEPLGNKGQRVRFDERVSTRSGKLEAFAVAVV